MEMEENMRNWGLQNEEIIRIVGNKKRKEKRERKRANLRIIQSLASLRGKENKYEL